MKRCPQCEFIYEDDQSLCDMDGVLLVFDSRTLPNGQALTTTGPTRRPQPKRKRAVPAFATLILALVLAMVYYVSIQRRAAQNADIPPAPVVVETSAAPVVTPAQVAETAPAEPQPAVVEQPKTALKPAAAVPVPAKKISAKSAVSTPVKPATPEKKEESKVGSILKKTGRILKKPFKL